MMNKRHGLWKHGMSGTSMHRLWIKMIGRCTNKNQEDFERYGGRGIKICERWRNSFTDFMEDMGPRPSHLHTVDRVDNDGDYCPDNCKWATRMEQSHNKSNNKNITLNGVTKCIGEWARDLKIKRATLYARFRAGLSPEQILSTSVRPCGPGYGKPATVQTNPA